MKFREVEKKSGIKLLLGRNARNNEELIKKFKGKGNIILHTASPGSPFCVIAEPIKLSKRDVNASGAICAGYSQDWRDNKNDVKVHSFTGKDIYKRKGMKLGTFGVRKFKVINIKRRQIEKWKE